MAIKVFTMRAAGPQKLVVVGYRGECKNFETRELLSELEVVGIWAGILTWLTLS